MPLSLWTTNRKRFLERILRNADPQYNSITQLYNSLSACFSIAFRQFGTLAASKNLILYNIKTFKKVTVKRGSDLA